MNKHHIVEKKNRFCIHGVFNSKKSAKKFLKETIPMYCEKGYYQDKTLTPDNFEVIGPIYEHPDQRW